MATFDTANAVLLDVSTDLAIGTLQDGMSSQAANAVQLRSLLKRVGRGLVRKWDFLQLRKDFSVVTTSATSYDLPADFLSAVDGTGWNDSQTRPLVIANPQEWSQLRAEEVGSAYAALIRPRHMRFEVWPQPPATGETIRFEYRTKFWVQPAGQTSPTLEAPTAGTDVLTIDAHLLVCALRHAWLAAKSMPQADEAYNDLREALEAELGLNAQFAPDLSLNGGFMDADPLLSVRQLPTGGYGGGLLQSSGLY